MKGAAAVVTSSCLYKWLYGDINGVQSETRVAFKALFCVFLFMAVVLEECGREDNATEDECNMNWTWIIIQGLLYHMVKYAHEEENKWWTKLVKNSVAQPGVASSFLDGCRKKYIKKVHLKNEVVDSNLIVFGGCDSKMGRE